MAREFRVDLRGVVELLARHVYSSPRVFVRELLQNGVDAVTARRQADPTAPLGPLLLQPSDGGGDGALVVSDPGIGLDLDDVQRFLATIGAGSKRDELALPRTGFLGRFGIGILSCFVVAEQIEVVSRSVTGAPPVRWIGSDDGTYEVSELSPDDDQAPAGPGTIVRLHNRPNMAEWVEAAMVELLAERYGAALSVPVLVQRPDGEVIDITDPDPPWRTPGRAAGAEAWCERKLGFSPLGMVALEVPAVGLRGTGFVLPYEAHLGGRSGAVAHLAGMLVSDDTPDLAPDWAFFLRLVVDADGLNPTASREALVDDEALALTRAAIGDQVREWLLHLARLDDGQLRRILEIHGRAAKSLAVHDPTAFATLANWLPFETTDGVMTLPEIVSRTGTVRFTRTVDRFRQLAPIATAQQLVVVNGGYSFDADLLDRVGDAVPGAESIEIRDDEVVASLDDVSADRRRAADRFLRAASEALVATDCRVELRAFDPEVVPALLLVETDQLRRRELRRTRDEVVDPVWSDLLASLDDDTDDRPRLVCNDRNVLVRQLVDTIDARSDPDAEVVRSAVSALYVQALLLGRRPLRGADLALLSDAFTALVDRALRYHPGARP